MNQLAIEFAAEGFVDVNLKLAGKSMQVVAKMIILCLPVTVAQVDLFKFDRYFQRFKHTFTSCRKRQMLFRSASIASLMREVSAPPVCAMSGRPPPPFAPINGATVLIRPTAEYLPVRSSVTPITAETLPSLHENRAMTPLNVINLFGDEFDAVDGFDFVLIVGGFVADKLFFEVENFRFQAFFIFKQKIDSCFQVVGIGF